MHQFSNILKIPPFTDYYKDFIQRIERKLISSDNKTVGQISSFDMEIDKEQSNTITQDKDKQETLRLIDTPQSYITKLKVEEYEGLEVKRYDEISPYDNKFIIDVNVVDIFPKKINDCLSILCDNCYSTYTVNSIELNPIKKIRCSNCKKEANGIIHYNMVLHCIENLYSNKIIILHLCTYDNLIDDNIFGIAAADCYSSKKEIEVLNLKIKQLLSKDSYIRVKCETYQTGDKEAHYLYRIIGGYEQL